MIPRVFNGDDTCARGRAVKIVLPEGEYDGLVMLVHILGVTFRFENLVGGGEYALNFDGCVTEVTPVGVYMGEIKFVNAFEKSYTLTNTLRIKVTNDVHEAYDGEANVVNLAIGVLPTIPSLEGIPTEPSNANALIAAWKELLNRLKTVSACVAIAALSLSCAGASVTTEKRDIGTVGWGEKVVTDVQADFGGLLKDDAASLVASTNFRAAVGTVGGKVTSVNGKIGEVILDSADVGARSVSDTNRYVAVLGFSIESYRGSISESNLEPYLSARVSFGNFVVEYSGETATFYNSHVFDDSDIGEVFTYQWGVHRIKVVYVGANKYGYGRIPDTMAFKSDLDGKRNLDDFDIYSMTWDAESVVRDAYYEELPPDTEFRLQIGNLFDLYYIIGAYKTPSSGWITVQSAQSNFYTSRANAELALAGDTPIVLGAYTCYKNKKVVTDTIAKTSEVSDSYVPNTRKVNGVPLTQDINIEGMTPNAAVLTNGTLKTKAGASIGATAVGAVAKAADGSAEVRQLNVDNGTFRAEITPLGIGVAGIGFYGMFPNNRMGGFSLDDWFSLAGMLRDAVTNESNAVSSRSRSVLREDIGTLAAPAITNTVNEVKSEFFDEPLSVNWSFRMVDGNPTYYATTNVNQGVLQ